MSSKGTYLKKEHIELFCSTQAAIVLFQSEVRQKSWLNIDILHSSTRHIFLFNFYLILRAMT